MTSRNLCAVYDFELMPYALGDVLTWNVQTAIRSETCGRQKVDVHIGMDERYPASIYQKGTVTAENCGLFLNELFGAFGTHPLLGNLHFYRQREDLLEKLRASAVGDAANAEALEDYERALGSRGDEAALNDYFIKYIYSHDRINAFAAAHGRIPLLLPSMGCGPDVEGLVAKRFAGHRIVAIHVRLRKLDAGYGGAHTYGRDSDFLEWYEFLSRAEKRFPDVRFVVMGRLQEKPLALLRMSNVVSLRTLGLGLGHELTLLLQSDLFIGTSSGFAAMANFCRVPYFITRMNPESCNAYRIPQGCDRLPFATDRQRLVYEPESCALLLRLLEEGLAGTPPRGDPMPRTEEGGPVVRNWGEDRARWLHPGATTSRFFVDDSYGDAETTSLVWSRVEEAEARWRDGEKPEALALVERIEQSFPGLSQRIPELSRLRRLLDFEGRPRGLVAGVLARGVTGSIQRWSRTRAAALGQYRRARSFGGRLVRGLRRRAGAARRRLLARALTQRDP